MSDDDPIDSGPADDQPADDELDRELASDPFEELADGRDRDGDPFEELADEAGGNGEQSDPFKYVGSRGESDRTEERTAGDQVASESADADPADRSTPGVPSGDPFDDYEPPSGDPFESERGIFDSAGDETIDPDLVWERLAGEADGEGRGRGEDVAEVSKHSFCERCEHFSPPPEIECSHEGTEIVEFLDMETVRLVDCPVVAEQRRLGGLDE